MTAKPLNHFFTAFARVYAQRVSAPLTVIVTGATAGLVMGSVRPSLDVDFAVILPRRPARRAWEAVEVAAREAAHRTGLAAQFAEDIGRWSMISFLDYARHTRLHQRFGVVEVRLLDPAYWAIGKLARSLDSDIRDLVQVLRRQRVAPDPLARLWGRALRASPRSTACGQFRRQVEHFFERHGRTVWGRRFDPARAIVIFHRAAGVTGL